MMLCAGGGGFRLLDIEVFHRSLASGNADPVSGACLYNGVLIGVPEARRCVPTLPLGIIGTSIRIPYRCGHDVQD